MTSTQQWVLRLVIVATAIAPIGCGAARDEPSGGADSAAVATTTPDGSARLPTTQDTHPPPIAQDSVAPDSDGPQDALRRTLADAKRRGVDFRAAGQEPGWYLEITDRRQILYVGDYGETRFTTPAPAPQIDPHSGSTTYTVRSEAHSLDVTVGNRACSDAMSGAQFEATVIVVADGKTVHGCGSRTG
jgi:uncharacterized membrane protein